MTPDLMPFLMKFIAGSCIIHFVHGVFERWEATIRDAGIKPLNGCTEVRKLTPPDQPTNILNHT
jgi:hypothetical protein